MGINKNYKEIRKQRGLLIAKTSRIQQTKNGWKVPSQSGKGYYLVKSDGYGGSCNCADFENRGRKCKHIWAIELILSEKVKRLDKEVVEIQRPTYSQDWKNYNLAQTKEKELFMKFLSEITSRVNNPAYNFGRPTNQLSDMIYSMIFKVYSGFSGRRFNTDITQARDYAYITKRVSYNSMFDYFNKEDLTPILSDLVTISALPLKEIEKDFTIDATGFGTLNFQRWYSFKHGREITSRKWVKCHFVSGVISNVISSVKITTEFDNDCPHLEELYNKSKEFFNMEELSGDKAYLSINNLELIERGGTKPFIPFKKGNKATGNGETWNRLYHLFSFFNEKFLKHYHKRSNAESTVYMIKSKFGDRVRSKNWTAQVNEVLCKCIAHNICCVIMEMFCLGVKPDFDLEINNHEKKDF